MLAASAPHLSWEFWLVVTRLGEAQLLFPTALALAAWFAMAGERRAATLWLGLFGLAFGLTTASKVAFIGWGVGIPRLNFTGFSGHAMHSAAVLPLLLRCAMVGHSRPVQALAVAAGLIVAAVVATSRVVIGAHSVSESIAGFALGAAASLLTVALHATPSRPIPHWLLAVLLAAQLLNPLAAPSLGTHGMVTHLALAVSGHDRPYSRAMLRQRGDCWVPDWSATSAGRSCS